MNNQTELRVNLRCHHCLELGLATYHQHPSPSLTALYGRFHSERGRAPAPLIVCNECDAFQDALVVVSETSIIA